MCEEWLEPGVGVMFQVQNDRMAETEPWFECTFQSQEVDGQRGQDMEEMSASDLARQQKTDQQVMGSWGQGKTEWSVPDLYIRVENLQKVPKKGSAERRQKGKEGPRWEAGQQNTQTCCEVQGKERRWTDSTEKKRQSGFNRVRTMVRSMLTFFLKWKIFSSTNIFSTKPAPKE